MKKKITVLTLYAMLSVLCSSAQAQPTKIPRIGFLSASSPAALSGRIEAFRQGLRELGYVEGKNIVIEWRSAEGKLDRLPALAAELVRLKVDVILSAGPAVTRPVSEATKAIPIAWRRIVILLETGSSPVLRDLAATLLDCQPLPRR